MAGGAKTLRTCASASSKFSSCARAMAAITPMLESAKPKVMTLNTPLPLPNGLPDGLNRRHGSFFTAVHTETSAVWRRKAHAHVRQQTCSYCALAMTATAPRFAPARTEIWEPPASICPAYAVPGTTSVHEAHPGP